jgi:AMP deaminase
MSIVQAAIAWSGSRHAIPFAQLRWCAHAQSTFKHGHLVYCQANATYSLCAWPSASSCYDATGLERLLQDSTWHNQQQTISCRWHPVPPQVWKLSATDLCEIARASVLHSGFPHQVSCLLPAKHPGVV